MGLVNETYIKQKQMDDKNKIRQDLINSIVKAFNNNPEAIARELLYKKFQYADLDANYQWLEAEKNHYEDRGYAPYKEDYEEMGDWYKEEYKRLVTKYFEQ